MTATTPAPATPAPSPVSASPTTRRTPQWLTAFSYLSGAYVYMLTLWFWAIVLPAVALILFVISRNVDQVTSSGVVFSHHGALWFPFSIAIILAVTYLPLHVANGLTRRSFTQAALVVNVVVGVLNGVISTLALLAEREIFESLDWFHGNGSGTGVEVFQGGVLPYAAGLILLFTAGQISGSLVGITYYRLGGWFGTIALPLCLLPLGAAGLLGVGGGVQWEPWGWAADIAPWGAIATIGVLVAAAWVFHLLVRDVSIDSKKA